MKVEGLKKGWVMHQTFEDEWHIFPEDEDHLEFGAGCACQPLVEQVNGITIITHNSYDGREALEKALEILNSTT